MICFLYTLLFYRRIIDSVINAMIDTVILKIFSTLFLC